MKIVCETHSLNLKKKILTWGYIYIYICTIIFSIPYKFEAINRKLPFRNDVKMSLHFSQTGLLRVVEYKE